MKSNTPVSPHIASLAVTLWTIPIAKLLKVYRFCLAGVTQVTTCSCCRKPPASFRAKGLTTHTAGETASKSGVHVPALPNWSWSDCALGHCFLDHSWVLMAVALLFV